MTVRILGVVALSTFMASVPAQAQEGMTLTLGRLLHQPPSRLQQAFSVTNGTGKIAKLVQVECGFFNEGQLIAAGSSVVQNVSPNTTGYTQIAVTSDSNSDRVDCRIASVQLADTPAAADRARQTAPAQGAVVAPGDVATPAAPNEKVDAVAVNIALAYAVTDSDLCLNYKSSYEVSKENVTKYIASQSVPAHEVEARLRDKTFIQKKGSEWGERRKGEPQAACDEIIQTLGPNGIGLLQPASPSLTKSEDTRVFGEENLKDIVDSADHNTIRFERDYKDRKFNGVGAFARASKANLGIGDSIAVTISVKKGRIVCFVDKSEADTIADWKGGTKVRFSGTISGTALLGGTLQLKDCVMTRLQ